MVIAVASPSGVNILGSQSQHLPQESTGTLLFGVPSKLVGPGVMLASRGRCCHSLRVPLNPLRPVVWITDALLDACRQRGRLFATDIIAETEPRQSILRDSAQFVSTASIWRRAVLSKPFANVVRFLIPVQQHQGDRRFAGSRAPWQNAPKSPFE